MWHILLTFFAATAISVIWIVQGLDGAPRRFSVLPGQYDQLTDASIPLVVVLALAQLLLVWNVVQTLRGQHQHRRPSAETLGVAKPRLHQRQPCRASRWSSPCWPCSAWRAAGWAIGGANQDEATAAFLPPSRRRPPGAAPRPPGCRCSWPSGCGGCHVLAAADGTGTVGPNLDQTKPERGPGGRPGHQRLRARCPPSATS